MFKVSDTGRRSYKQKFSNTTFISFETSKAKLMFVHMVFFTYFRFDYYPWCNTFFKKVELN